MSWCVATGHPLGTNLCDFSSGVENVCESLGYQLPTRQQFADLLGNCPGIICTDANTCVDGDTNASATCTAMFGSDSGSYWASDSYHLTYENTALYADFQFGSINYQDKGNTAGLFVRCVRTEP